ncbi:MAG TPA: WecB/TagA/CpsF family glycosyltransferase [Acidimicrobiales bacterium]|nr:WecB/TagA/CpsF family glycosyltransferase [Acidimicrobiales bacterium]
MTSFPRYPILGSWVDSLDRAEFLSAIRTAALEHRRYMVLNHNMHSLALCQTDEPFRQYFERADMIFIDGSPVVAVARFLGQPITFEDRHAVLDWFWPLLDTAADDRLRVLHVGSHDEVTARARNRIAARRPKVDFVTLTGFFDQTPGSAGSDQMIRDITDAAPDIILLGFGMPRQEHWLAAVYDQLPACPIITVGGILGFIGDERPPAPRWMGRFGIEWTWRLATEPRRLWRRYLVEPWVLVRPFGRELAERRRSARKPG